MYAAIRKQRLLLGTGAAVALLGILAGAGVAAGSAVPVNTTRPTISGTAQQENTLTGDAGTWANNPTDFNYFWLRCDASANNCATIAGANASTYTLLAADVGHRLRFRVQAKNADGSAMRDSSPTGVVSAAPVPVNTARPTISGTPQQGMTLTGTNGTWSNNPTGFNYFWLRCDKSANNCTPIAGANATSYILLSADVGHRLRFRVQALNAAGSSVRDSDPSAVIAAAAGPANVSRPTISGPAQQGTTLTGDRGQWSGNPTDFSYSWLRCDKSANNCSTIAGATSTTYLLTSADVGSTVRFRVAARNGNVTTVRDSLATGIVAAAPAPAPAGCPGGSDTASVAALSPPARLLIDRIEFSPPVVRRGTSQLIARFHVSACGGRSVQGALVYATAVPFNQLSVPSEQTTGSDGWAVLEFHTLAGFPATPRQRLIAMFVRARKPGEDLLAGISARRLVSARVNLRS